MTAKEIETALQAFAAAGADRGLFYLSTPITTGRRLFEMMDAVGADTQEEFRRSHAHEWRKMVVDANESAAMAVADRFIETVALGRLVINPVRIHRDHWEQPDYDLLWRRLIEEFPVVLVPVDGWAFSRGARFEVALALELALPILNLDGTPRTPRDIAAEALQAEREIHERGWTRRADDLPEIDTSHAGTPSSLARRAAELVPAPDASYQRQVLVWLSKEHTYQTNKFGTELDDRHTRDSGLVDDGWWADRLAMYFHRARVIGLENPGGRQALAKYVATGCSLLESVVRLYGWLPAPGVTSGEIHRE